MACACRVDAFAEVCRYADDMPLYADAAGDIAAYD